MSRRQTRLSTIAFTSVVVVLGLLVAVNYLSSRRNKRWDLTANQQFSLSPQTRQILEKLDAPIKVRVFDKPTEFDRFRDRLSEYEYVVEEGVGRLHRCRQASHQGEPEPGAAIRHRRLRLQGQTERVTSSEESQLTNGLIKLITGKERKVYFLQGHGEKDTANSERTGYSAIAAALGSENFKVDSLVLLQQQTVPADATIVAAAGPTTDLFPPEIEALKKYLQGGGKVLLLLDPPDKADAPPLANLIAFAKEFGIDVGTQRRGRCQRRWPDDGDRRFGAGRREISIAPDHREVPAGHRLSAGAVGDGRFAAAPTGTRHRHSSRPPPTAGERPTWRICSRRGRSRTTRRKTCRAR